MAIMRETLRGWLGDARDRTLRLASALGPEQLLGPRSPLVNPPLWELGHVAWFQERWILRHVARRSPLRRDGDALYDSAAVPHDARWTLPLPSLDDTVGFLEKVRDEVLDVLDAVPDGDVHLVLLTVFHEDMHAEAMAFTRQTLGYARPHALAPPRPPSAGGPLAGDVEVPGGTVELGAPQDAPFAFDNEQWAHPVTLEPFAIARAPVTQREYAAFVEEGGYARRELWTEEGWRWREEAQADAPAYWRREGRDVLRRDFAEWVTLEPHRPIVNVCWHEASAYCRWAGRRLPTEAEWEAAASAVRDGERLGPDRRRLPWGDEPPGATRANVGFAALEPLDVGALPRGDSALGCRQLVGNVWEWTASDFLPYPGFSPGLYREYSEPWFGTHKVLRGGSFATTARLVHNGLRNFYTPDRRDLWAGFRTCAR
jgi:iron(II)-dependent oxidoreductase